MIYKYNNITNIMDEERKLGKKMISDFLSTVFIDHHLKLKKAWQKVIKTKNK